MIPACKTVLGKILGQHAVRETENVPLFKSTINRNTGNMSRDAQVVLRYKRKTNNFCMQVY
jgi:hypothetical protein